jgi:diguanylate cyclase (GGDEF)-like protein
MALLHRPSLEEFPASPYAAELSRENPNRRFAPALEAEYISARLIDGRTLIRWSSVLALLLALSRVAEQVRSADGLLLVLLCVVLAGTAVVTVLAWSSLFARLYLPWAQIIIPLRNVIAAAYFAQNAAHGQPELLMTLPLMLIGPYYFMGLRFRAALVSGVLTTATFVVCAIVFRLAPPVALRADLFLLAALVGSTIAALELERSSRIAFLEGRLIEELALLDALTGTRNRRMFDEHLARVWSQAARESRDVAILLVDVDHFKAYNDRYGHLAGDDTLRRIAQTLQAFVHRPFDILSRYGGEEFAAVLYDVDCAEAREIAERMRRAVTALAIEHRESPTSQMVTISIGLAVIQPTAGREATGALQLADQALYEAKVNGRNRVELMDNSQYQLVVTGVFPTPLRVHG